MNLRIPIKKLLRASNDWFQNEAKYFDFNQDTGLLCDIGGYKLRIYDITSAYLMVTPCGHPRVNAFLTQSFKVGYYDGRHVDFMKIAYPKVLEIPKKKSEKISLVKSTLNRYEERNKIFPAFLNKKTIYEKGYLNGIITQCKIFLLDNEKPKQQPRTIHDIFKDKNDLARITDLLIQNQYSQYINGNLTWDPNDVDYRHRTKSKLFSALCLKLMDGHLRKDQNEKTTLNLMSAHFNFKYSQDSFSKHRKNQDVIELVSDFHFIV